ncbi:MAG: NAD(P)(+) transhydrogenase (Re/Si-specific) subunit beta [Gloeomargarita sp. SKYBB_i_bin120]|nr:NAD(P)(+) transhydrogenase (Re/Si-specific) subunit beta [Gloeomargarita sp. SKYG98]MCS7292228.1 NAD(P)(+) transhydrogenase (Re/Si-specific) subunit beta [Gloeomargarita sp. SKYB120]MDW8177789.1 NAD(P)(+) transhydrogenase (Re/Si-specific) subunit beta [Gloeomargarita sp. SKYBB_i_bin120]
MDLRAVLPTGIELTYLLAVSLFIVGIKRLSSPATARLGNRWAALGMLLAVVATLFQQGVVHYGHILVGLLVGSLVGTWLAYRVEMTAMPQMVGLLNGLGGGASVLIAAGEFWRSVLSETALDKPALVSTVLGVLIGAVTFTGSLVAFAKLQGWMTGQPVVLPGQRWLTAGLVTGMLAAGVVLWVTPLHLGAFSALLSLASVLGVLFVLPVGGADMPVVISLLNAFSGLAAAATGFIVLNDALVVSGALVGASGLILTQIMCKAMNRPLANVLFGALTAPQAQGSLAGAAVKGTIRRTDEEETAMMLAYARSVVIVPGYGMAVAQAQHVLRELADALERRGVAVKYAIHPVAGRMPGHMNVLLAEANVPYTQLYDMEAINPEFEHTDVVLVVGANDVVNPAARHDKNSPIYGMPILEVDKARRTVVIKRSMNPGYSGIENELFYKDRTAMLFGNAREVLTRLLDEVKQLA